MRQSARALLGFAAACVIAAGGVVAASDGGPKRPRPPDAAKGESTEEPAPNAIRVFNDDGTPERVLQARNVVVHFVAAGINAPPLNDGDRDGLPDYVERVARAADDALSYFTRSGFRPVRPDTGGPNALPDVYISRFAPGYLGIALPANRAAGGAFVAVANWLDPSRGRSFGSLFTTVAHEFFHLVQFSYFPADAEPPLPAWVLEGSAGGLARRAYPKVDDVLWTVQTRPWAEARRHGVQADPYAAELFWRHLDARDPRLLPALLSRLATHPREGTTAALAAVCEKHGASLAGVVHAFARAMYAELGGDLATVPLTGARSELRVWPLAASYMTLPAAGADGYRVRVLLDRPRGLVTLVGEPGLGRPGGRPRVVRPATGDAGSVTYLMPAGLRRPTLVLTAGRSAGPSVFRVELPQGD